MWRNLLQNKMLCDRSPVANYFYHISAYFSSGMKKLNELNTTATHSCLWIQKPCL
jgi:hypothetical protein